MNHPNRFISTTPVLFLAAVLTAIGLCWAVEVWVGKPSLMARAAFLTGGAALAVLVSGLSAERHVLACQTAKRYIEMLCQLDVNSWLSSNSNTMPDLPASNSFRPVLNSVRQCLHQMAERVEYAEHQRTAAEARVHRVAVERDQLKEILSGMNDPVVAIDSFGEVILANAPATKLLHLPDSLDAHPALEQLARCEALVGLLTETRKRRVPTHRSAEVNLPDDTGRQHWFRISCKTFADEAGTQEVTRSANGKSSVESLPGGQGVVAVLTDITHEKAIQKRNAEFVSAVSHEMKTPLSSVRAYVELLADGDAEDEATREEFLGVIHSQTERLQRLIDNLLNLSRIEAGVVHVNKAPRSLNELLEEAVNLLQPAATHKQMRLVTDLSPLYLGVLADRDTLLQAAINLVSNALKYTPEGGTVTVRSRLADESVVFEVQDTGVGLSPEDRQKVFEKFYRVKKDQQMAAGTGLGLPLVKHIVEDVHGGRIEVESELGRGSTFRIILPSQSSS
ncbi:Alkaline phosphatase synthesis sensor protein PhoR [Anatilimnocola aggregata]|uniref:histidine kinase n=1 Tax=Anatilimnocola aggregata TaxID=2528021 RepID=A0A517YJA5_9BACT|nr:ATP-binding protein [Anatilimnocola aggregata]QDU30308.1 Alkaline phosphatase synthesis sensor protein PhoR [Anatilimnocola aggregata]